MTLSELLDRFQGLPVLVVGDLMLDEYHFGKATRISPEAPVMVIRHEETEHLPGGAANVALNVKALGGEALLVGIVGDDAIGSDLRTCLAGSGLGAVELAIAPGRKTTRKTRIVADHAHQVLRMDTEDDASLDADAEAHLIRIVEERMPSVKAVILSDYLKGVLTPRLTREVLDRAHRQNIPVIVNPKPRSLNQYEGADLISLNRVEASEAAQRVRGVSMAEAVQVARELRERTKAKHLLVTLGESGMVAVGEDDTAVQVPAPKVEVYDTAGAGDTVVATVAAGLATAGFQEVVFRLAAQTAACVVRHVGVATPSADDLEAIRRLE